MTNSAFDFQLPPNTQLVFRPAQQTRTFRQQCVETARYVRSQTDRPIVVALSGGIDSEVVCRSFLEAGIDFSVLTMRYSYNLNQHDIRLAEQFCKTFGVKQDFVNVDLQKFYDVDVKRYANQGYQALKIFRYLQLYLMETINAMGATAVLGGGEQVYYNNNGVIQLNYNSDFFNALTWTEQHELHFPYFFQTTPEVVASYLQHELIQLLIKNAKYFSGTLVGNSPEKILVYHSEWPDMTRRPKYTGFESWSKMHRATDDDFRARFPGVVPFALPVATIQQQLGIHV
jgi:hypothetical protein